jgi:hypothetical protein
MTKTRTRLRNSIIASKVEIDYDNIENTINQISKLLSDTNSLPAIKKITMTKPSIYHMDSLYRDNSDDKYYLCNQKITQITNQNI